MITLEGYKIIKKIGSGGMGDAYLAEHEVLETKVAIKSLHSNLVNDESFRTRFRTEAKVHAKLDHPNIVKLIDYKESKEGLFLIMEYVEGKQLDDYIYNDSGPIPEKELLPLFAQILDAISHAHEKGLVHRDIKPANVIISKGKIKVLDFGIAKELSTESGLTKTGVQVGTPMYMSPEQVNGEKIDKLTDIYSLGVTLFYMAAGKPPYENSNAIKMGIRIISEPFPTAKEFYPGVSEKVETIINKATQKKKTDRYQSCEEFKNDLDSSVVKSWKNKPTEEPTKKKSFVSGKILVPILVVVAIVFGLFYFFQSDDENNYLDHFNKAEKYYDDELYDLAISEFDKCLFIHSEADSVFALRGMCYLELEEFEKSINDFSEAILINPLNEDYFLIRGWAYDDLEKYQLAITDYTSALKIYPDDADAYNNRGNAYSELENYTAAIADYSSALKIEPDHALANINRGDLYYNLENYKDAIADYSNAIRIDPDDAISYRYRGIAKENIGQAYCSDYKRACDLGDEECCEWYYKQCR
jgi:tetratricopeptide (TPR) repeat protein/tRNA A-37 threonylcarbamoyl transferase component Bud32